LATGDNNNNNPTYTSLKPPSVNVSVDEPSAVSLLIGINVG
jgi:hypothetical protein